jgi:hypothetical protein
LFGQFVALEIKVQRFVGWMISLMTLLLWVLKNIEKLPQFKEER